MNEPHERLALLNITISTLPSMFVRGFKRTATNIVDYYEAMGDACMDQDLRSMVSEQQMIFCRVGRRHGSRKELRAAFSLEHVAGASIPSFWLCRRYVCEKAHPLASVRSRVRFV